MTSTTLNGVVAPVLVEPGLVWWFRSSSDDRGRRVEEFQNHNHTGDSI